MDQSFIVAEELVAVQEYDPCELKEQGESAEYAGEAFAKQAVREYMPSEWKVQGKSEESFREALAKYAVQEYAHSGRKDQGESEESFGEAFAKQAVLDVLLAVGAGLGRGSGAPHSSRSAASRCGSLLGGRARRSPAACASGPPHRRRRLVRGGALSRE